MPSPARSRRPVRIALAAGVAAAPGAVGWLGATGTPLRPPLVVAVVGMALGIMALAGLLMALLFWSSRSGHDWQAAPPEPWP